MSRRPPPGTPPPPAAQLPARSPAAAGAAGAATLASAWTASAWAQRLRRRAAEAPAPAGRASRSSAAEGPTSVGGAMAARARAAGEMCCVSAAHSPQVPSGYGPSDASSERLRDGGDQSAGASVSMRGHRWVGGMGLGASMRRQREVLPRRAPEAAATPPPHPTGTRPPRRERARRSSLCDPCRCQRRGSARPASGSSSCRQSDPRRCTSASRRQTPGPREGRGTPECRPAA